MTVVTTRPNATIGSSGFANTGGGSRHGATSDNSDGSYILSTAGATVNLGFAEPTIPAGGLVKSLGVRARTAKSSVGTPRLYVYLTGDAVTDITEDLLAVTWGIATTTALPTVPYAVTPTDVRVSLLGDTGDIYVHELFVDTVYVAKPVTAPSAPTGTVTATNIPTITWANTLDSDGGTQAQYQVRVFTSAQYGAGGFNPASSGALYDGGGYGATSHALTTPLANGAYRAYVRVAQTVNGVAHWSDYAYTAFTVSIALPADPDTPTLTVQTGRIKVHVEGNTGSATTTHLEVQRSEDAGTTWEPLRLTTDTGGIVTGTTADLYDYEAPNGTLMTYRVRALHEVSVGNNVASAWVSATATWTDTAWWLKCPESPGLNMVVVPNSLPGYQRPARQGVFQPLGSQETVIVADKRGNPRGTLRLQIDTQAEQDDLDTLLDANATLLLQGPPEHHWTDRYIRIGDQDRQRWIDKAWVGEVLDTLQWWEVTRPAGIVDSWPA